MLFAVWRSFCFFCFSYFTNYQAICKVNSSQLTRILRCMFFSQKSVIQLLIQLRFERQNFNTNTQSKATLYQKGYRKAICEDQLILSMKQSNKKQFSVQIAVQGAQSYKYQIIKMRLNIPEASSAYFQIPFYTTPHLFLYSIQPTPNFTSLESLQALNLPSSILQQNYYNQASQTAKTEKTSKPQKPEKTVLLKQTSLYKKSQILPRTTASLPQQSSQSQAIENQNFVTLDFRIQWKNQYRNVVPNVINQILSFLTKKCKSQSYLRKLFAKHPHPTHWHLPKFYQYIKRMKDDISHYVNEKLIYCFFQIHETSGQVYEEGDQEYYMKITRIAVLHYLRSEAINVSLTSPRMYGSKRMIHLIAREAILQKFLEIAHNKAG